MSGRICGSISSNDTDSLHKDFMPSIVVKLLIEEQIFSLHALFENQRRVMLVDHSLRDVVKMAIQCLQRRNVLYPSYRR